MASMDTKKRKLTFRSGYTTSWNSATGYSTQYPFLFEGKQETVSARYPMYPTMKRYYDNLASRGDLTEKSGERSVQYWQDHYRNLDWGNEFWTLKNYYRGSDQPFAIRFGEGLTQYTYMGELFAQTTSALSTDSIIWPTVPSFSSQNLACIAQGAKAIAITIPTNPVAQSANFFGELFRDGIPSIIGATMFKDRAHFFKSLGSEYLNIEFGWKPFISDLRKFAYVVKNANAILEQLERDSGKGIRRRHRFPSITSTEITTIGNATTLPALSSNYYSVGTGKRTKTRVTTTDYWFSGEYRYYVATGDSTRARIKRCAQEAEKLLGLRITPEVLWNLAPWSWLVDWFSNVGSLATNVSRFSQDGLQMRYGYVMCQTDISDTYSLAGVSLRGNRPINLTQTFGTISKIRKKATPYGFGLNPDLQFSARQWAILAALGISRGKLAL